MIQQLPLIPSEPNYRVGTVLDVTPVILDVHWNGRDAAWFMDIMTETEVPIVMGVKIVLGTLLGGRTSSQEFPLGVLVAADLSGEGRDATLDDLGTRVLVYFYTPDEIGFEAA
jgi:hypothetical protein